MYGVYDATTLEMALAQEMIKMFAAELGMTDALESTVVQCSQYIDKHISSHSSFTMDDFISDYKKIAGMHKLSPHSITTLHKTFNDKFICPLLLGTTTISHGDNDPHSRQVDVFGAVFRGDEGQLYSIIVNFGETDLDPEGDQVHAPEYFLNGVSIGHILTTTDKNYYNVPEDFFQFSINYLTPMLPNRLEDVFEMSQHDRDNYDNWFI